MLSSCVSSYLPLIASSSLLTSAHLVLIVHAYKVSTLILWLTIYGLVVNGVMFQYLLYMRYVQNCYHKAVLTLVG